MWSSFGAAMERANQLAKQAQVAAEKLEKRLDDSLLEGAAAQSGSVSHAGVGSGLVQEEGRMMEQHYAVAASGDHDNGVPGEEEEVYNDSKMAHDLTFTSDGWSDEGDPEVEDLDVNHEEVDVYVTEEHENEEINANAPMEETDAAKVAPDFDHYEGHKVTESAAIENDEPKDEVVESGGMSKETPQTKSVNIEVEESVAVETLERQDETESGDVAKKILQEVVASETNIDIQAEAEESMDGIDPWSEQEVVYEKPHARVNGQEGILELPDVNESSLPDGNNTEWPVASPSSSPTEIVNTAPPQSTLVSPSLTVTLPEMKRIFHDEIQSSVGSSDDAQLVSITGQIEDMPQNQPSEECADISKEIEGRENTSVEETKLQDYETEASNTEVSPLEEVTAKAELADQVTPKTDFVTEVNETREAQAVEPSKASAALVEAYLHQIQNLEQQLIARESQLQSKTEQISVLMEEHKHETGVLQAKVDSTKEEAKKRILRAKERVEELQSRLAEATKQKAASSQNQASRVFQLQAELAREKDIVQALREEGEALAHKQSSMEQSVRAARGEVRDLAEALESEHASNEKLSNEVEELKGELKCSKSDLDAARKEAAALRPLESKVVEHKEEQQSLVAVKASLEQQVKELQHSLKQAKTEAEEAKVLVSTESQQHRENLSKYQNEMLQDLEEKLKRSERESNLREDSLRQEIADVRKRWQDAVRRADSEFYS
jgi:DNA repair exonuclease SbcCD ATPase subunit